MNLQPLTFLCVSSTQPANGSPHILWYNPDNGSLKVKCYVAPDTYTDGGWLWREIVFADTGKSGDVYNATADTPSS